MQFCGEDVMSKKAHGTSNVPVQKELRWNVDRDTADRICSALSASVLPPWTRRRSRPVPLSPSSLTRRSCRRHSRFGRLQPPLCGVRTRRCRRPVPPSPSFLTRRSWPRHSRFGRYAGYWKTTNFLKEVDREKPTVYYDSNTGKPLFVAPIGRTMGEFLAESNTHGWPSFRNQEVVWENVRILKSTGEVVSVDGTHLGHK